MLLPYSYERKANQFPDAPSSKRLNNELLAQLCLAFYLDLPSKAKNSKTLVFGDKYDAIFDEGIVTAERMLTPLRFYEPLQRMKREIQRKKRRKETINEREAFVSRATFHILNVIRRVSEKENLPLNGELYAQALVEKAIQHIGNIAQAERIKRGELYTHDKFSRRRKPTESFTITLRHSTPCKSRQLKLVPRNRILDRQKLDIFHRDLSPSAFICG